jgi:beta-N-acetylhexosaminidase
LTNPAHRIWVLAILLTACTGMQAGSRADGSPPAVMGPDQQPADATVRTPEDPANEAQDAPLPWAEATLQSLSLRQKVAQMMMPFTLGNFAPEGTEGHERVRAWIQDDEVGGIIMSVGAPTDVAAKINDLQRHAPLPLLVAADLEAGAGFRFSGAVHVQTNVALGGATSFPSLMAFGAVGDTALSYQMGRITALEARTMGVQIQFAPVLDVNNNPENPIINIRSFGEDPDAVARLGVSFVRGIQDNGGFATGKHFPGHGDTEIDSHLALPVIAVDRARMDSTELKPFRAAIAAGIRGVMTAHIAVPEITGEIPSTLSGAILTDLLKDELGFDGLVFTDAMDMAAVDRMFPRGEATVEAIRAGADVILMPPDVPVAIEAVVAAVQEGRLSEERIDASVQKLLALKAEFGLDRDRMVPLEKVIETVGIPEHTAVADEVARRSITVVRNGRGLLPLLGTRSARVLSVRYRPRNDLLSGRYFDRRLRATYPRLITATLDAETNPAVYGGLLRRAARSNLVIVSVYSNFAGRIEVTDEAIDFIQDLSSRHVPHIVVSFGNPYLIKDFPDIQAYMLAWSTTAASQRAAGAALFGEFEISGRSPIGAPPYFEMGAGVSIPQRKAEPGG